MSKKNRLHFNSAEKNHCPCKKGLFHECCGMYLAGLPAPTAETLMRSRYTAFVLENTPYLLATWHHTTRPNDLEFDPADHQQWLGLEVKHHRSIDTTHAEVEFIARYKIRGRAFKLHEISQFIYENNHWYYVTGSLNE